MTTTENLSPSEANILAGEDRPTLLKWKAGLQYQINLLDSQIADAKSRAYLHREYADPVLFRSAEKSRRDCVLLTQAIDIQIGNLRGRNAEAASETSVRSSDDKLEKLKATSKRYGRLMEVMNEALGAEVSARLRREAEARAEGQPPTSVSGYRTNDIDALSDAYRNKEKVEELSARLSKTKALIEAEKIAYQPNMPLSWYDARDQTNAALARILKFN